MPISNLIGSSPKFRAVLEAVGIVAPVDCAVLILGETGTGKEVIAQAIHDSSPRRQQRFVTVNCAAIPAGLLESELFGHERGAFPGAVTQRLGRFQTADRGTLFLDEIGELPIELQPKLLRALQEQEFERLGSSQTTRVDVRIVAATNQNLDQMVTEGRFRMDLYYRLNVFPIVVPPLRERAGDIPLLVAHFLRIFAERQGKSIEHLSDDVMTAIERYNWPGNIREPQDFIERSVVRRSFPQRARWCTALLAIITAATASAQASGGAIRGTVSDPSGAAVPGPSIRIEEVGTSENLRPVSSSAGVYNAPNLPLGRYNVTVKALDFSTAERTNIDVQVGSERVVNVQLAPRKSEERVTVALQAATVDLATSQTGAVNSGEVVRELPLNGRDWTTLAALQPEVSIVRTLWSTWWFKLACAFAVGLMAWLSWRRLRARQMAQQLNQRFEDRLRERTRIARELHDTLFQSFHGLLFRFQAVDNLLPARPGEAKQLLESALDNAAQAITEARDAVHELRSSTVVTNDLAAAVTALGKELIAHHTTSAASQDPATFLVEVEGTPQELPPILRDEVYRIAGEALRNAFRHSRAQRIEVEIRYGGRELQVRIRDDGSGIDPSILSHEGRAGHWGLLGMRERAKRIGGQMDLWSKLGAGTEVDLRISASVAYQAYTGRSFRLFRKEAGTSS
jgi:signal transduction histidine kinase